MPVQKTTSSLIAKLGARGQQAHEKHRLDETTFGIISLPPGISGGVAQLVTAKWDEFKTGKLAGQPYVLLRGIAKLPHEHKGTPVRGQGVMITIPLCDTPERKAQGEDRPRNFDDNYADLLNEFRRFGIDTTKTTFADLEAILGHLQTEKPHYRYSTRGWTGKPTPQNPKPQEMVFVQFDGACPYSEDVSTNGAMRDNSVAPQVNAPTATPTQASAPAEVFDETAGNNIPELVKKATAGNQPAKDQLVNLAKAAGRSDEEIENTTTWQEVADMVSSPTAENTPDPDWKPELEDIYKYTVIDKKTGKPAVDKDKKQRPPVDVEVIAVDEAARTVDLKNTANQKVMYKGVSWDNLESAEAS